MQKTVVGYTTDLLVKHGLRNLNEIQKICDIWIYPSEYFCPKSYLTAKINITPNTYSIHHYDASWQKGRIRNFLSRFMSERNISILVSIKRKLIKGGK